MMKKLLTIVVITLFGINNIYAQDHKWALGFYGDVQLESPDYTGSFGIQGKYDFALQHGVQAQVNGRANFVSVGADYIFNLFDKRKSNVNVFIGGGIAQDFHRTEILLNPEVEEDNNRDYLVRDNFTILNAQVGISYYMPDVNISVYTGYKLKTDIEFSGVDPNYLMFGLRYHLW